MTYLVLGYGLAVVLLGGFAFSSLRRLRSLRRR